MFKKLKEKITEEVKSSPQRFAEFTQSVSDRLQNSTNSDENFFSIGEEEVNTSANSTDHGFSSVPLVSPSEERFRRNSNTSLASDVSFLPRYESGNMYHLQSDLDVSTSEIEDNASTSSSQLGHLSKEQIYSAFQKSQMRYHKYRGRYTDLARHYKDLERENAKMKSVLVETQDKAIRRVNELKEQCNLEQKAKAHLESALRDEIDEKNIKIQTLQTKIDLLQTGNNTDLLVDIDSKENENLSENLDNLTKYLNDARKEIEVLNEKNQELKANSIIFQTKEQEYKAKISSMDKEISHFAEREKESNIKLAQSKMELHNEILSKDAELSNLKKENEVLKQNLDALEVENKKTGSAKLENLQVQNKKLIEKVENLSKKCNNLENELLKVERYKIEIQNLKQREEELNKEITILKTYSEKLEAENDKCKEDIKKLSEENLQLADNLSKERKDFENKILTIREDAKKGLLSLEPKIREKLQNEHLQKEEELKREYTKKLEEAASTNGNLKEIKLELFEKDDMLKKLAEELESVKKESSKKQDDYVKLEKNHLELIEDTTRLRGNISNLEREKISLENYEEKISRLEAHINTLQEELNTLSDAAELKEKENLKLNRDNFDLQQSVTKISEKFRVLQEKYEAVQLESSESKLLELKVQKLQEENKSILDGFEVERKMFNEMLESNKELKEKEVYIENLQGSSKKAYKEIAYLKETLAEERETNVHLHDQKLHFEKQVEKLKERVRVLEEKDEAVNLNKNECGLLELKIQKLEEENKKLMDSFELERNCFARDLDIIKLELNEVEQNQRDGIGGNQKCTNTDLREKLADIKRLSESREKQNVCLSEQNLHLQQENDKLSSKLRLLEEKYETIKLDSTESKLLELKVQKLEEENKYLMDEFEMERIAFNELIENHKEGKEKEELIIRLEESLFEMRKEIVDLNDTVAKGKEENISLHGVKLNLEKDIIKLEEKIRILEEKEEAIQLDKNECSLLEIKLKQLETEKQNLLESFEMEREIFNKACTENEKYKVKIMGLVEENLHIKEIAHNSKAAIEQLNRNLRNEAEEHEKVNKENVEKIIDLNKFAQDVDKEINMLQNYLKETVIIKKENESNILKLNNLNTDNDKLRKEVEEKNTQISELSKNIANLSEVIQKQTTEFNSLLERTQQLESVLEKIQKDSTETIKKEKERQNELTAKIQEMQKELHDKAAELTKLNNKLLELEKKYAQEKDNYKMQLQEIQLLKSRLVELQALEESCKILGKEKQIINDELTRLKVIENSVKILQNEKLSLEKKLKEANSDIKTKNNEALQRCKITEQECNILKQEKEDLLAEISNLRGKIEDLSLESGNLKVLSLQAATSNEKIVQLESENKSLQEVHQKMTEEVSELNIRIHQISSDNRNMLKENQSLLHSMEELKIKTEYLEKEKDEYDVVKNELTTEKNELIKSIEEVKQQLNEAQKQNLELARDKKLACSNETDISKIQQDFYEIKDKCDKLFVENKNLKLEYTKLEEKCNDFGKVKLKLETQISELENQYTEILHEKQLLQDEVLELKTSPMNLKGNSSKLDQLDILKKEEAFTSDKSSVTNKSDKEKYLKEIDILRDKLTQYKSLDITNKSSIEFYENELQKMKNQNEKLNRKLDETLVTLNHCTELSSSTEVEYLKNVLYNYMLGKESLVLARVIAAVCKFDPQQTETVLQKEQQKQSLLGQLGLI